MSKRNRREKIACPYFTWLIGRRDAAWQDDGRSNTPDVGRHSLGTDDRDEGRRRLVDLDRAMAVKHGLAAASSLQAVPAGRLALVDGRVQYMDYVGRPRVAGGVKASSRRRYKAVFDKFFVHCRAAGIDSWNQVTALTLGNYAAHLQAEGYAFRTQHLELTILKQVVLRLVKERALPPEARIDLPLERPEGTQTYCWRPAEVQAMIEHCLARADLAWLGSVILALATTGLRISELLGLRWSDIDLDRRMIRLADESSAAPRRDLRCPAHPEERAGRSFPIQEDLFPHLSAMPHHPDGRVFRGPRGGRLDPPLARRPLIRDVLSPLAPRFLSTPGEVGFRDGRLHSFRHFFCSLCANLNVTQRVVMSWLGHTDSRMVAHYYHHHDEEARRQMSRVRQYDRNADGRTVGG